MGLMLVIAVNYKIDGNRHLRLDRIQNMLCHCSMLDAKCIRKTCRPSLREIKVPAVTALKLLTEFAHPETLLEGSQGCLEEDLAYGITQIDTLHESRVEDDTVSNKSHLPCLPFAPGSEWSCEPSNRLGTKRQRPKGGRKKRLF